MFLWLIDAVCQTTQKKLKKNLMGLEIFARFLFIITQKQFDVFCELRFQNG